MEQKRPTLVTTEESSKSPLLIIDKQGTMGVGLSQKLHEQFLVVIVTGKQVDLHGNLIHIPYQKKIPLIPDNAYSHFFVFYNGEPEILDMLPPLLKKAKHVGGKIFFITSLPYVTAVLFKQVTGAEYAAMQVLIYGEVFHNKAMEHTLVNLFLYQAKKYQRIEIPNNGVGKLYPVLLEDVYTAIISSAFGSEKKYQVQLIFPKHPISELSVAHMLQKQNPLLKLDFAKYKGTSPHYYIPTDGEYFFSEYPLEKKIQKVAKEYVLPEGISTQKKKKKLSFPKAYRRVSLASFWVTLVCLLLAPIVLSVFAAVSGAAAMQFSIKELEQGKITSAVTYASFAKNSLSFSETLGENLFYLDPFIKPQKQVMLTQIGIGRELAETEVNILTAVNVLQKVAKGESKQPKPDFLQAVATLKNSLITLQKMRAENKLPRIVDEKIVSLEPVLLPLQNTIDTFPNLLGFEGKRMYLVLFQNNMELRPGGGFIGSYGLLTLENGRVQSFKVNDVYDADGKLTFHIEPPFALRRYLGASHWFLRDSNFAIDFPTNASQARTFLQYETGEKVDGVIGVDTSFLKGILSAMGEVTVPDYKETVTADNFYLRTQTHAERDFFPGSTQKKDFLRALVAAMQARFTSKQAIDYRNLVNKIGESLIGKHLMFAFADEATQKIFAVNNLSGSLWDGRAQRANTYQDFLGISDANVGINKGNYYVKRSIEQKNVLDAKGTLSTTATITYTNTSQKDSPFGGDYKNYVRFILPANIVLREVRVDDVLQDTVDAITDPEEFGAKGFVQPKGFEIESTKEQGKDVLGFFLIVPTGATKKLSLTYDVVGVVSAKHTVFTYDSWMFKQPGTYDDTYTFSFVYPPMYQVVRADKKLGDVGGKLFFSDVINNDVQFLVEFSKK